MPTSNFIAHNPAALWRVPDAFRSVYSHAAEIAAPNLLFISGQFGVAPDGRLPADFAAQCQRAMDNVEPLLAAAVRVSRAPGSCCLRSRCRTASPRRFHLPSGGPGD